MADYNYTYSIDLGAFVDSSGVALRSGSLPRLILGQLQSWKILFKEGAAAKNLSSAVAWLAVIDSDFSTDTEPMCRTIDVDIDKSLLSTGYLTATFDADTTTFETAVAGASGWNTVYCEFQGYNSNARLIYRFRGLVDVSGLMDGGGDPGDPISNYYTKAETLAVTSHDVTGTAVGAISALKVVAAVNGGYSVADPTNIAHAGMVVGVARTAASNGGTVSIVPFGTLEDSYWNWSLYTPAYLGLNGTLTQTCPTSDIAFTQQIGFPLDATTLMIRPSVYILA